MQIKIPMVAEASLVKSAVAKRKAEREGSKKRTHVTVQRELDKLTQDRAVLAERIKELRVELRALKPKR